MVGTNTEGWLRLANEKERVMQMNASLTLDKGITKINLHQKLAH